MIYLGIDDTITPRVVEQEDIPHDVKYMTLSHRWNENNLIRLTTVNYADFAHQIDKALLPKTFIEAMEVTRQLGMFYLWIDSLCIVQDSVDDWQRESSLMSGVYTGSWCNIAATNAYGRDPGLYTDRDPREIRGCILKDPTFDTTFKVETDFYGSRNWEESISKSPLMKRGWVLQETTLAPRTLHFGPDRLFWQCATQKASEDSPYDLRVNRMRYYEDIPPEDEDDDMDFHGPPGWATVVHQYTRCQLTFPAKDKLVAISGIAKKYGAEDDYVAGLWWDDLLVQLTWRVFVRQKLYHDGLYQAPSWSWASTNKEVKYSWRRSTLTRIQLVTELVDVEITPVSQDSFGQVSSGRLRLRGPLLALAYRSHHINENDAISWGTLQHDFGGLHSNYNFRILPGTEHFPVDLDVREDPEWGEMMYCMPIYYERESSLGTQATVHGLVLKQTDKRRGEFERRGTIFLGDGITSGEVVIARLEELCRKGAKEIPKGCYESRDGPKNGLPLFTISIV